MRVLVATLILCIPFSNGRVLAQSLFNFGGSYHAGSGPRAVGVADLNNDGNQDLVIANYGSNNVTILLGNGKGGFTEPKGSPFVCGPKPTSVAVGDFNGDSKVDLAVANFGSPFPLGNGTIEVAGSVSLLLGDGNGAFTPAAGNPFRLIGIATSAVVARDVNGDGKLDLIGATSSRLSVLFGDGRGGFSLQPAAVPSPSGIEFPSLTMADFDGDGRLDVAVADDSQLSQITIGFGNGSGAFLERFSPLIRFDIGRRPVTVASGDFNGDGRPDLIAGYGASGNVLMWPSGADGQFSQPTFNYSFQGSPNSVAVGDFNNDGKLDWTAANGVKNNVIVMLGDGSGGFSAASGSPYSVGTSPQSVAVGDFNNDGKLDVVTANQNDVTILLNSAQPVLQFSTKNSASYASSAVFAPDTIAFGEAPDIAPALVVAPDGPWPTSLGGVKLEITDSQGHTRLAPIYYVTTGAISYLIPAATATGQANARLTTSTGATISGTFDIGRISPGLYTANSSATGVAAGLWIRVGADGTQSSGLLFDPAQPVGSRSAVPIDLGPPGDQVFLSLYGTGFRNSTHATATFAGFSIPVYGVAAVGAYQGEDVINIGPVPRSVAGYSDESLIAITFDDNPANTVTAFVH